MYIHVYAYTHKYVSRIHLHVCIGTFVDVDMCLCICVRIFLFASFTNHKLLIVYFQQRIKGKRINVYNFCLRLLPKCLKL